MILNQALIWSVHRGTTVNLLTRLTHTGYVTLIKASLGYYNFKLDKKSSYLIMFSYQISRHKYARLPFSTVPAGTCSSKTDEILMDLSSVFGIENDIYFVWYEVHGYSHDTELM